MNSNEYDQKLFHKLIRRQRNNPVQKLSYLIVDGTIHETSSAIENAWVDYFEKLSKASSCEQFNEQYKTLVEHDLEKLRKLYEHYKPTVKFTNNTEIYGVLSTMSNNKAPDELSLMAEHLKNGGHVVLIVLEQLMNKIYDSGTIPEVFKTGIITPVFKKQGKPIDDPNSYRRITICSVIGKLFEKLLQNKISNILDMKQSKLQRGFTKNVPPTNAGLIFTEMIAEAEDEKYPLYAVFIDASKAFDVVWHASLLRKLHESGITENDWKILDNWYKDLKSRVKWDGNLSRLFNEEQGVRQGGILSPLLYKVFINPLLKSFEKEHLGASIGSIHVGCPTCADDILLLSKSLFELQTMLIIQEDYANSERYFISETKSKVMTFNSVNKVDDGVKLTLNNKPLENVDTYTHIGIQRYTGKSNIVAERIKLARRTSYALMGAGLHGYNGVNLEISLKLWNTYVRPRLLFGLESVVLKKKDYDNLNLYHKGVLKNLQSLPERTADAAVYLLSGQLPMESTLHYQILIRLGNILRSDSVEKEICVRQLLVKDNSSKSWFIYAKNVLDHYEIGSIFDLIGNMPSMGVWKKLVKQKVEKYWKHKIEMQANTKSSLKYLNCLLSPGTLHSLWTHAGKDNISI